MDIQSLGKIELVAEAVVCCWHSNLRSRPEEDIT